MTEDNRIIDSHSADHFKDLQVMHGQIKTHFKEYNSVPVEDSVPNFEERYMRYRGKVDIYSFLKPIMDGYRNLIATEGHINPEQLANYIEASYGVLHTLLKADNKADNLMYVFAWFEFHTAHLRAFKNGLQDFTKLYAWLRICYDTQEKNAAHFFDFFQLSRQEEMRQVVFDRDGKVREFFHSPHFPGHVYLDKLATWFVARYDLDAAFVVHDIFTTGQTPHKQLWSIGAGPWQRLLHLPALWLTIISTGMLLLGQWDFLSGPCVGWGATLAPPEGRTFTFLPYQVASLLFCLFGMYCLLYRGWYNQLFRMLPRLFGGILAGYIPLLSSEELWKWLLSLPKPSALSIWLLALIFSLVYLYAEARTKLLSDYAVSHALRRDVIIRSVQVYLIGLAEAYVIGVVLCEVWGATVVNGLLKTVPTIMPEVYGIKGWLGVLVPKVIVLYAPLALSLGILVQLFWEEKTVTQPL